MREKERKIEIWNWKADRILFKRKPLGLFSGTVWKSAMCFLCQQKIEKKEKKEKKVLKNFVG